MRSPRRARAPATRTTSLPRKRRPRQLPWPRPSPPRRPALRLPRHRATSDRPAGIFVPKWVGLVAAAIVAALIFGGIGYAIGDSSDSGTTQNASNVVPERQRQRRPAAARWRPVPRWPAPERRTGTADGNGNGNGGGSDAATPASSASACRPATDPKGVEITDVADGSPAAKAGLQARRRHHRHRRQRRHGRPWRCARGPGQASSGDEISVTYTRDGQSSTVKVTLTSRSQAQSS